MRLNVPPLTPALLGQLRRLSRSSELGSLARKFLTTKKKPLKKPTVPAQFEKQLKLWPRLLQCEIDAQNEEAKQLLAATRGDWTELEQRGMAISGLHFVKERFHALDGRIVVLKRLGGRGSARQMLFREGSPVILVDDNSLRRITECILLRSSGKNITLKIRAPQGTCTDEITYALLPSQESGALQSLRQNLTIEKATASPGAHLLNLAYYGEVMPSIHNDWNKSPISEDLNESQKNAVAAALNKKRPFVCIQGPPGTGKTRVVAEIIKLLAQKDKKVLVCAPSNVAVDNAMHKAAHLMKRDAETDKEADTTTINEAMRDHPRYPEIRALSQQIAAATDVHLRTVYMEEFRTIKSKILRAVYKRRRVICCTLTSVTIQMLPQVEWEPDVVIIDEAAQCIEPQAWGAIIRAKRCILVGDHAQLPAVILSEEAQRAGFNISLMERLCSEFSKSNISFLLSTQYRMNEKIMRWSSDTFYESRLTAAEKVADIKLSDICLIPEKDMFNEPMIFIDTGSKDQFREEMYNTSRRNFHEASVVSTYTNFLLNHGLDSRSIGIISPYFAQVQAIRSMVPEDISVNSVDGFQGQEREVIIFSLVRNNPQNFIGFLKETRRMNVAVTRARRQFCMVGNRLSMMQTKTLKSLFEYIQENGKVYSLKDLDFNDRLQSPKFSFF